jgi:predicted ester cyclase
MNADTFITIIRMDQLQKNKEFIINYLTAISGIVKTRELAEKYMTDDVLISQIQYFDAAFPGYEVYIDEMIAEGNLVVVQARFKGIHQGNLAGIAPTHKTVDFPFVVRYKIENNKIVNHWLLADQMVLMEQLGVVPSAQAAQ